MFNGTRFLSALGAVMLLCTISSTDSFAFENESHITYPSEGSARNESVKTIHLVQRGYSTASPITDYSLAFNQRPNGQISYHSSSSQEFGFADIIDLVNPLHHIPLVGPVYRSITGDEILPPARVIGGALFTGPIGAAAGVANVISEAETGKEIAELIVNSDTKSPTQQQEIQFYNSFSPMPQGKNTYYNVNE